MVDKIGIRDELDKKSKELSGGNKRKLSVCIALLGTPDLLIFDEPTSGLDPYSRRNIWTIIEELKKLKCTVILTTHHLDEADHLSDRVCVIERGSLIAEGTPSEIKDRYGRGYYLSIHADEEQGSSNFDATHCHKAVLARIPQVEILERETDSIKYFINQKT